MSIEQTFESGELVAEHHKPRTYTISVARKVPRDGGYGAHAEVSVFGQVDIEFGDTDEKIEEKLKAEARFLRSFVLNQLSMPYTVVDGVVIEQESPAPVPPARQQSGSGAPPARRSNGGASNPTARRGRPSDDQIAAVWEEYKSNPDNFYDNRGKKSAGQYKPTAADFTRKSDRFSLWLNSAPADVKLAAEFNATTGE